MVCKRFIRVVKDIVVGLVETDPAVVASPIPATPAVPLAVKKEL